MLRAIVTAKTDHSKEPEQFNLKFPGDVTKDEFVKDLDDKIGLLTVLRDQFSNQAKIFTREANEMQKLGLHF